MHTFSGVTSDWRTTLGGTIQGVTVTNGSLKFFLRLNLQRTLDKRSLGRRRRKGEWWRF